MKVSALASGMIQVELKSGGGIVSTVELSPEQAIYFANQMKSLANNSIKHFSSDSGQDMDDE